LNHNPIQDQVWKLIDSRLCHPCYRCHSHAWGPFCASDTQTFVVRCPGWHRLWLTQSSPLSPYCHWRRCSGRV